MGWIDRIAHRLGYTKTRTVDRLQPWQAHYAAGEQYHLPDPALYGVQADYYRKLSWIAAAVQILAQTCAAVDFGVYQVEGEEESEMINHDFERLLYKPNPLESRFEFLEAWLSYRILTGNGYAWLNRSDPDEPPAEIWSLPSNMIIPVPDGKMFLKGYLFYPGDGAEIPLDPHEIVHLKRFNPANKFIGLSPIEAVAQSAQLDLLRVRNETKTYGQNNGRLPAILTFPEAIPDLEWNRMKAEIDDKANTMRNYLMLRNTKSGVGVVQSAITAQDTQYIENRTFTKEEIYAIFAPGLASMTSVNATEANSKSGKATFTDFAVYPLLESAGQKITNDILPAYGPNLRGKFKDTRVKDMAMLLQEIAVYSQTHTIAEIRRKYYGDPALGDSRDALFTSQITASSGAPAPQPVETDQPATTPPEQTEREETRPVEETLEDENPDSQMPMEGEGAGVTSENMGVMSQKTWKELEIWRTKAVKMLRAGQPAALDFRTEFIRPALAGSIAGALEGARTVEDVKTIFRNAAEWRAYP